MKPVRQIAIFTDRFPLVGPIIWVLGIQYFVTQLIVASAWPSRFSWVNNYISDLGNTACGQFSGRAVCSPGHVYMNISFIALGVIMTVGSLLIYQEFRESRWSLVGFGLMALAGIGGIFIGLFPENTIGFFHQTGAFFGLGIGDLSLIILAVALRRVRWSFRIYTLLSGVVSLAAFVLFISGIYLGIGAGTMERIASYPQTLWLVLFGVYMMRTHLRRKE